MTDEAINLLYRTSAFSDGRWLPPAMLTMIHGANERNFYFCFRCHRNGHDSVSCQNARSILQESPQKQIGYGYALALDDSTESGRGDVWQDSQSSQGGKGVPLHGESSIVSSSAGGADLHTHAPRQNSTRAERRDGRVEGRQPGFGFLGNRGSGFGARPANFTGSLDVSSNVIRDQKAEPGGRASEDRSMTPIIENKSVSIPSPEVLINPSVVHNEEHSVEAESESVREYSDDGWDSTVPVQTAALLQTKPTGRTLLNQNFNTFISSFPSACAICRKRTHETSDCPVPITQARGCFNCGKKGHVSFKCPKPFLPKRNRYCYNCERRGHLEVACRKPLKKPEPCANCGRMDHKTPACPEHAGAEQGPFFDRLLEAPVIVNDVANQLANVPLLVSFEDMKYDRRVLDNITRLGFTEPTPIQQNTFSFIQNGDDLLACACSGSGKSAAFLLPIISKLVEENDNDVRITSRAIRRSYDLSDIPCGTCFPRCLVITPTHELAQQLFEEAGRFAKDTGLTHGAAYGGMHMSRQKMELSNGAAILIATPGRLLHLIEENFVSLKKLRFFVLDEADRMIGTNFHPEISKILDQISDKSTLQTLMFSMTFSQVMQGVACMFLKENYTKVIVDAVGAANKCIHQDIINCPGIEKLNKLMELLNMKLENDDSFSPNGDSNINGKTVIFVERKSTAQNLFTIIKSKNDDRFGHCRDYPVITSIHSDLTQPNRTQNLHDFEYSKKGILIATGVAERGLELKHIDHVINYDLPDNIDTYVHRIGRSGRRGNEGKATSLYSSFRDRCLAKDLVECMKKAEQDVPDWLEVEADDFFSLTK